MSKYNLRKGKTVTSAQVEAFGTGYNENGKDKPWDDEITALMKQFCLKPEQIESVIMETKRESKETDTNEDKYNMAWRKFKAILMAA